MRGIPLPTLSSSNPSRRTRVRTSIVWLARLRGRPPPALGALLAEEPAYLQDEMNSTTAGQQVLQRPGVAALHSLGDVPLFYHPWITYRLIEYDEAALLELQP